MAKTWYPVVDYGSCIECGTCVSMCSHGVYDADRAPTPIVCHPVECIDHCHGCGNRCPVGAITYVGDNTGWTPPSGSAVAAEDCGEDAEDCGCGCDCGADAEDCGCGCDCGADAEDCGCADTGDCCCAEDENKVSVSYLYLDDTTCTRCAGTGKALDEVMLVLTPALEMAGFAVVFDKIEMTTAEIAQEYRFLSSPTIRVNGNDICEGVVENGCACCGEISGTDVDCRVFPFKGQTYEVPPKEMLAEAILRRAFAKGGCDCGGYELPANLKAFYAGKTQKSCCCDGAGNCC